MVTIHNSRKNCKVDSHPVGWVGQLFLPHTYYRASKVGSHTPNDDSWSMNMNMNKSEPHDRELSQEQWELIEAIRAWESAECMTCSARFATQQEAVEHDSISHPVFHRFGRKVVN